MENQGVEGKTALLHVPPLGGYEIREQNGSRVLYRPDGNSVASFEWALPWKMIQDLQEADAEVQRLWAEEDAAEILEDLDRTERIRAARILAQVKRRQIMRGEGLVAGI